MSYIFKINNLYLFVFQVGDATDYIPALQSAHEKGLKLALHLAEVSKEMNQHLFVFLLFMHSSHIY